MKKKEDKKKDLEALRQDLEKTGNLFVTGYVDLHSMSFAEPAPVCENFGQHTFCGPIGLQEVQAPAAALGGLQEPRGEDALAQP